MRRYLIAGLIVWIPLGITIWVLHFLLTSVDQILLVLPANARPRALFGFDIPGLGLVFFFVILLLTGVLAANFFGQRLIYAWESILGRIPFVKSIYSSVKQVSDTLLSDKGYAFRKALLVEFPRPGSWTIAFLTGTPSSVVTPYLTGEHISVYVPTTPNPTGGYFLMLPRSQVRQLDMTGDEPLRDMSSIGVVVPREHAAPFPPPAIPRPSTVASDPAAAPIVDSRN